LGGEGQGLKGSWRDQDKAVTSEQQGSPKDGSKALGAGGSRLKSLAGDVMRESLKCSSLIALQEIYRDWLSASELII